MHLSARLLVVVMLVACLAFSFRIKAPNKPLPSVAAAREQKYLEQHGAQNRKLKKVPFGQSFDELQQFGLEAFPDEADVSTTAELHKDHDKEVHARVKLAIKPSIEDLQKDGMVKLAITPSTEKFERESAEALPKKGITPASEELQKDRAAALPEKAIGPTTGESLIKKEVVLNKGIIPATTEELRKDHARGLAEKAIRPVTATLPRDRSQTDLQKAITPTFEEWQKHLKDLDSSSSSNSSSTSNTNPDLVKVAGLDFNTDVAFITKVLHSFGTSPFQKALANLPCDWPAVLGLHCFGSEHHWLGGWLMGCPDEGTTELREDHLFISSRDTRDENSMALVPRQWMLEGVRGYRSQKNIIALRRSTKSWLFGKQPNLCLWTGEEVVVLNDDAKKCWSHRLGIEKSQRNLVVDLCK